eukprot:362209-Chlamydomonas_euryale.AAC.11
MHASPPPSSGHTPPPTPSARTRLGPARRPAPRRLCAAPAVAAHATRRHGCWRARRRMRCQWRLRQGVRGGERGARAGMLQGECEG